MTLGDLQRYADARGRKDKSPVTVRKEVQTFRAAWNWARRMGLVEKEFPGRGIVYRKGREKPPFQTMAEIERRISREKPTEREIADLWDSLYLTADEIPKLLTYVKDNARQRWIYPAVATAAHTGVRRSELLRARVSDTDLEAAVMTAREKKKDKTKTTTRRVPISPFLSGVLTEWLKEHPGGVWLFTKDGAHPLGRDEFHHHFKQTLSDGPWSKMRGPHCLRHSFISACASKGINQRIIEAWVGHLIPETQRRYAHIAPATQQDAMRSVFD